MLTPDKEPVTSPSLARKALAGHWEGEYGYVNWDESRKDAWALGLPPTSASVYSGDGVPNGFLDVEVFIFDSSGADMEGGSTIYSFVVLVGCIWFVKLCAGQ